MITRKHSGWSHGLRPGTISDMNCRACQRKDAGLPVAAASQKLHGQSATRTESPPSG